MVASDTGMDLWKARLRHGAVAGLRLLIAGLLLGWFYAWAAPLAYPRAKPLGFGHGMLHGALMPMALPSLLLGQDVEIFAPNHNGRGYKLGYICGINVCGLVFFGAAFARPRRQPDSQAAVGERSSEP
ncbi:MAG: hypothetical protein H7A45_03445 [Verrucomicrobiales bacterium]|nr:hypothetical protein [Verrucomicrobiales bacterium]MCP5527751.1 hypothetical protein [Verrucomicrobiales bacterium]